LRFGNCQNLILRLLETDIDLINFSKQSYGHILRINFFLLSPSLPTTFLFFGAAAIGEMASYWKPILPSNGASTIEFVT